MENKKSPESFEYKENEIKLAIEQVQNSEIPDGIKLLIINCLKTCLSINSLLQKNRSLRRLIGRLFGFKSEKSKKKVLREKKVPQSPT